MCVGVICLNVGEMEAERCNRNSDVRWLWDSLAIEVGYGSGRKGKVCRGWTGMQQVAAYKAISAIY